MASERATPRLGALAFVRTLLYLAEGAGSETSTGALLYCASKRLTKSEVSEARASPAMMCTEARAVSLL